MVKKLGPEDYDVVIKFGHGLHTRPSEDEIDGREAADGANFLLDLETRELRPRKPFDLVGTAPNAGEIRGGGSLLETDGTVSTFFQAGNKAYKWNGTSFQASPALATVNSSAKLRGHWRSHNWTLDDKLLITDLSLLETVKEWDGGNTISNISFLSAPSVSFGSFYAKYLSVTNERAMFAHVRDTGQTTPHMIVVSKREDYRTISVSDRPSSDLAEDDPCFMLSPDLKPINGLVEAFRTAVISTEKGKLCNLAGESAQDFAFEDFYPGSAAAGAESMAYVGNDVVYGRQGRVESVSDTARMGDTEADDLTKPIADVIREYGEWRIVYNSRLNRVYMFPDGISEVWAWNTSMRGGDKSPFMRWKTNHSLGFQPTFAMSMLDPADGLEYVFMGDSMGRVFRLEGSGANGDGGDTNISVEYLTKLFSAPLDARVNKLTGYIRYRKTVPATIRLRFEYAGEEIANAEITEVIPGVDNLLYFGGPNYYGGSNYFGTISGRLARKKIFPPGRGNEFQVRVMAEGTADFTINEIGLRLNVAG